MTHGLFHTETLGGPMAGGTGGATGGTVGNPLYDVLPGHFLAGLLLLALPVLVWALATARPRRLARIIEGFQTLPALHRLMAWLLLADATIHVGLALGHGGPGLRLAFLLASGWSLFALRRLALGRPWRLQSGLVLGGSLVAYWLSVLGGEPPDQVGIVAKLIEIAGLTIVIRPARTSAWRSLAASGLTIALVVTTATVGWAGAVAASGGAGTHDHAAAVAPIASRLPPVHGEPTTAQREAALALHAATASAIARYADPAVAEADGYEVGRIVGLDHHAANDAYQHDGRILDPERPENLVYAAGPQGPVLLGAMFAMEQFGEPGPMVGGPMTVWHAHEHICLSLVPPGLAGVLSPLGGCPVGTVDLPLTGEMIHLWTVPGAPQPFGDLDEAWREAYLAAS
jgi:hypothetical protein